MSKKSKKQDQGGYADKAQARRVLAGKLGETWIPHFLILSKLTARRN